MAWRAGVLAACLAACLMGGVAWGQQGAGTLPAAYKEYLAANEEVQKLFKAKEYEKAAAACAEMIKKYPNDANVRYNMACAHARLGKKDEAIADLEAAVKNGLAIAEQMDKDDDLAGVRDDKRFGELVAAAKINARAGGKYEAGEEIAGVRTIEAFPEGGLRYRLRVPADATAQKPAKLVVWLHPSGGSMNGVVEKLSPELAKHGFALMVMTQKQFIGWRTTETEALVGKTLADVRTHKEIEASRPVLMGFSAGGQAALGLWAADPKAWSGLILDAAYPLEIKGQAVVEMELPADREAIKKTPIIAVYGGNDGAGRFWKSKQAAWRGAGVPLKIVVVPEKAHGWLLTGDVLEGVYKWLDEVREGKLPADEK